MEVPNLTETEASRRRSLVEALVTVEALRVIGAGAFALTGVLALFIAVRMGLAYRTRARHKRLAREALRRVDRERGHIVRSIEPGMDIPERCSVHDFALPEPSPYRFGVWLDGEDVSMRCRAFDRVEGWADLLSVPPRVSYQGDRVHYERHYGHVQVEIVSVTLEAPA